MTNADQKARDLAKKSLPGFFEEIIGPYELRVYYFEACECVRKISLVGLPVFFRPGTMEHIVLGLFICFFVFGSYVMLSPYIELKHNYASILCQTQ
eukprot:1543751-Prymnesium_polylepis.1